MGCCYIRCWQGRAAPSAGDPLDRVIAQSHVEDVRSGRGGEQAEQLRCARADGARGLGSPAGAARRHHW